MGCQSEAKLSGDEESRYSLELTPVLDNVILRHPAPQDKMNLG